MALHQQVLTAMCVDLIHDQECFVHTFVGVALRCEAKLA